MKHLKDFQKEINSCSKCGLCQSECPLYKVSGNDCTVSRGHFIMLKGYLNGNLKMSKKLNNYLDMCLKCNKCSKNCPSGIDVVDIIASAKSEYFKKHFFEKFISFIQKYFMMGLLVKLLSVFSKNIKSKKFSKKVIYYGGCAGKIKGNKSVVKLLNACNIEVISPKFHCCGIPLYARGDFENYEKQMQSFFKIINKYNIKEIVTTCASCEKTLNDYKKWAETADFKVYNIYHYIKENHLKLELNNSVSVTYHKPCNQTNWEDIEWILNNTKNLNYTKMNGFDECCGLNGIMKFSARKIISKICNNKHKNILKTGAKTVLTTCLGCEAGLKLYSGFQYNVDDLANFLSKNIIQ